MNSINNDLEIDTLKSNKPGSKPAQLPANFVGIGHVDNCDVRIYIKQDVFRLIEKFSSSDKKRELGGVLIGDYVNVLGNVHVIVSSFIEAKYTDTSSALKFTHETWDYIHREHNRLYPDRKIIGWLHTHPRQGIALSDYDLFLQKNFFSLPWQIAYIVDPVNFTRGFFQWKNGRVQSLDGFHIFDDLDKKINVLGHMEPYGENRAAFKTSKFSMLMILLLSIAAMGLIASNINLAREFNDIKKSLTIAETISKELNEEYNSLEGKYNSLESKNKELTDQLNQLGQALPPTDNTNRQSGIYLKEYTVQEGDTIASVCESLNIDFSSHAGIIKAINGLDESYKIRTGQKLLLPMQE